MGRRLRGGAECFTHSRWLALRRLLAAGDLRSAAVTISLSGITVALVNLWIPFLGEVALIAAAWGVVGLVSVTFLSLGAPFQRLSDALTPRVLDALRNGQEGRRHRLEATQRALQVAGETVVGFSFLAALAATVVALWGVRTLGIVVAVILGLAVFVKVAERFGLVDPSI